MSYFIAFIFNIFIITGIAIIINIIPSKNNKLPIFTILTLVNKIIVNKIIINNNENGILNFIY